MTRASHGYKYTAPRSSAAWLNNGSNGACTYCHDLFFLVWTFVPDGEFSLGRQLADRCELGELRSGGRGRTDECGVFCEVESGRCSQMGCCYVAGKRKTSVRESVNYEAAARGLVRVM
jgi:hypothetical protein